MRAVHPHAVMAYDTGLSGAAAAAHAPATGRVGLFGKLPDRGDFVRRDLPNSFVDAWDAWLQSGMAASRAALDEGWLDAWLCAPVWRFALPPGICGPDGWAGVMMPSVDRAGRYFPMTLAAMAVPGLPSAAMLAGNWMAGLERVALSALDEGRNFDDFADAVANLPAFPALRAENQDGGWRARGAVGDAEASVLAMGVVTAVALGAQCVFVTRGGGRVAPAAWMLPHLPPHRSFVHLIDDVDTGRTPGAAVAMPAGMAVPLAIGGIAQVAALPAADSQLGHAASIFGSEYATDDAGPAITGEPPGGAFDQMFAEAPQALEQGSVPASAPPAPTAMASLEAGPAWEDPVGQTGAAASEGDVTPPTAAWAMQSHAGNEASVPPMPAWTLPDGEPHPPGAEPASTTDGARSFEHPAGPQSAIALDAPQEHERNVNLSPKDLFGDSGDDVPPTPSGSLFDHNDGKEPAS